MATYLNSLVDLQNFVTGVKERAGHHAQEVEGTSLALIGGLIAYSDNLSDIRVRKNILWTKVNNRDYVIAYNHTTHKVEIRKNNQLGQVMYSLDDNTSSLNTISTLFKSL